MERDINTSQVLVIGHDKALKMLLDDWLSVFGWTCVQWDMSQDFGKISHSAKALILLDGRMDARAWRNMVAHIRGSENVIAGAPIVLLCDTEIEPENGVSGCLTLPLSRERLMDTVAHWCGSLHDHAFRSLANPHYRLVRLSGQTVADELILSFADHLEEALTYLDERNPDPRVPHQIAGLAGMIGYDDLSRAWRALDAGETVDRNAIRLQTAVIAEQIKNRFISNG
jgi:CheY-like chemotaxis protein